MSYKAAILNHSPKYWTHDGALQTELQSFSEEYKQIAYEARHAIDNQTKSIAKIVRIQNVHDLGQLLIREQLLVVANPGTNYYRVRRFVKLRKEFYVMALKHNLDHRRCGLPDLTFKTRISHTEFGRDDVLVVVQVVTSNADSSTVVPSNNLEYFIDYVVFFN